MTTPVFDAPAERCPLCAGAIHPWGRKRRGGQDYAYDRCRECDFAFVNPRPTKAWLDGHYSASAGLTVSVGPRWATHAEVPDPGAWPNRAIAETVGAGRASGRWLDIGAGDGGFSAAAVRAGLEVTALELDPSDLAALGRLPNTRAVGCGLEQFDGAPGSFDYVFMSHVLEHAHDPKAWVERAAALLSPGGVLAVALPHFNSVYRLLGGTRDPYFFPPEHLNHFNRRSLGRLVGSAGLNPTRWLTLGVLPSDVITKRVKLPSLASAVVRAATACVSVAVGYTTRLTGTGPVLWMLAVKR